MSTIKPVGDRVLVSYPEVKEEQRGGVWIPQAAMERPQIGVVLATGHANKGPKGQPLPFETKPGDKILVSKYAGAQVQHDDKRMYVINENDIIGVIEPAQPKP